MTVVHLVLGVASCAFFLLAGLLGAWRWYRVEVSPWFWRLLRGAQAVLVVELVSGGVLYLAGEGAGGRLHLLYALLPLLVSFAAEQLRVSAAEAVLDARGLESAQAVGTLPEAEQRSVVLAIVRREIGVMALASLIAFGLVVRAAVIGGG